MKEYGQKIPLLFALLLMATAAGRAFAGGTATKASSEPTATGYLNAEQLESTRVDLAVALITSEPMLLRSTAAALANVDPDQTEVAYRALHERLLAYEAVEDGQQICGIFQNLYARKADDGAMRRIQLNYLAVDLLPHDAPGVSVLLDNAVRNCLNLMDPQASQDRYMMFAFHAASPRPYNDKLAMIRDEIDIERRATREEKIQHQVDPEIVERMQKVEIILIDVEFRNLDLPNLSKTAQHYFQTYGPGSHNGDQALMRVLMALDILRERQGKQAIQAVLDKQRWLETWVDQSSATATTNTKDEIRRLWKELGV
jgi:hypothetical protein